MDWRLKVVKQALMSRIPFGQALRRFKRRHFGYEPDPGNLERTLANFEQMKQALGGMGRSFEGATVLEIGTGWFPTIPITLALGGAKRVLMSDLTQHMDEVTFSATLKYLKARMPPTPQLLAVNRVTDLPLTYLVPFEIAAVPDGTVDLVISRTVLEHIPEVDLAGLMAGLRSKLSPNGLMLHLIDHSDHLEHGDKSISKINFLTWSPRKHALVNYLLNEGENRLRHHQYQGIFEKSGYRVISATAEIHEPTRALVKTLRLVEPYARMTPDQLAVLSSLYVLALRE